MRLLRSEITPFSNRIEIVEYSRGPTQSSFLFSSATGQRFTLDLSPTFSNWGSGEVLEFLKGSGTLLYIEQNTMIPPSREYYRATSGP